MAGLVSELQRDALDTNVKVSELLRKAYVVATKLNIPDFKNWIQKELNGYGFDKDEIPNYRLLTGEIKYYNPACIMKETSARMDADIQVGFQMVGHIGSTRYIQTVITGAGQLHFVFIFQFAGQSCGHF